MPYTPTLVTVVNPHPRTHGPQAVAESDWVQALLLSGMREHVKVAFEDEAPGMGPWARAQFQVWAKAQL